MTCKDCLHLHVCKNLLETMQIVMDEKATEREKHCKMFTRREKVDKQTPKKLIVERTHYACFDEFFLSMLPKANNIAAGWELDCRKTSKFLRRMRTSFRLE